MSFSCASCSASSSTASMRSRENASGELLPMEGPAGVFRSRGLRGGLAVEAHGEEPGEDLVELLRELLWESGALWLPWRRDCGVGGLWLPGGLFCGGTRCGVCLRRVGVEERLEAGLRG